MKRILSILWQLPQDIVGCFMYPFVGKKNIISKDNGIMLFNSSKMNGAISLGHFVYLSPDCSSRKESIAHELGHCKQSRILGWLYLLIIGLPSILWATFKPKKVCYYNFYTEKWANKNAGLKVKYNENGCFTYFPEKEEKIVERTEKSDNDNSGLSQKIFLMAKNDTNLSMTINNISKKGA